MLRRLAKDDSGAVAIIVAVLLMVFLGFAVLAVDLGHWYNVRRQLQTAADAAAMAGCMDLAKGEDNATIWATVEDYAAKNQQGPLENITVIPPSPGGDSDIESDAVKVTVESDSASFFAHIFGVDSRKIHAQARAKTGWVYAVNGPVPWSISVLRVTEMEATVGGVKVVMSDDDDDGEWTGVAPAGTSGPVTITARNSQGYQEVFTDVVTVGSIPASSAIAAVTTGQTTYNSGTSGCTVNVTLKAPLPSGYKLQVGSKSLKDMTLVNAATNTYEAVVPLPTTSDPFVTHDVTVEYGKGNAVEQVNFAVLVRRANYILQDVTVDPIATGDADLLQISARTLDFQYGQQYQMKVEGGAGTTGNYLALDFDSLDHSACGYALPDTAGHSGGSQYKDYIVGDPDLIVHVDDYIETLPGDKIGPTKAGIDERMPDPMMTWSTWSGTTPRPNTPQLVVVPITEKIEDVSGRARLRIISFASFFVEQKPAGSKDPVVGRFVQFLSPGMAVGPTPPYAMANQGVYLTTEGLSY